MVDYDFESVLEEIREALERKIEKGEIGRKEFLDLFFDYHKELCQELSKRKVPLEVQKTGERLLSIRKSDISTWELGLLHPDLKRARVLLEEQFDEVLNDLKEENPELGTTALLKKVLAEALESIKECFTLKPFTEEGRVKLDHLKDATKMALEPVYKKHVTKVPEKRIL